MADGVAGALADLYDARRRYWQAAPGSAERWAASRDIRAALYRLQAAVRNVLQTLGEWVVTANEVIASVGETLADLVATLEESRA